MRNGDKKRIEKTTEERRDQIKRAKQYNKTEQSRRHETIKNTKTQTENIKKQEKNPLKRKEGKNKTER